jgi:anti-sigma-K factor RskA
MAYADPDRQREYAAAHYRANKARYINRARAWDSRNRAAVDRWLAAYLAAHHCVDCGECDPIVLEFDHRDAALKQFNVADARHDKLTLRRIQQEVAKCDVRCANCHRRATHRRRVVK